MTRIGSGPVGSSASAAPPAGGGEAMTVEIWSDVVCPWCYVGKRRFESALARFAHRRQVEVRWRSFELDPSAPAHAGGDADLVGHLAAKYGVSREEARAMNDRVTAVAAGEGLALRLDRARRGRTFDAHRLLRLGAARGVQGALAERLMAAYLTEGEPVADHQALVRAAVSVGLDGAEARRVLGGDAYADAVRADQADARGLGISAVPFFVVDRRYGVAGAQPADVVLAALEQAWAQRSPRPGTDASAEGG
ncbi:MAG: DsbA family oxidoreductase [Acidimicrobiales bacterium]